MNYQEASPQLIAAAIESEDAFVELYQMYQNRIFRFVISRVGNVQMAEDITQDTFVSVVRSLHSFTPTGAPFSSWLFTIAINQVRMVMRKPAQRHVTEDIDLHMVAEPIGEFNQRDWIDVHLALTKLNEQDQNLLVMKYVNDMPNGEIAAALQISPNTCGVQLHRALKRLQKYL